MFKLVVLLSVAALAVAKPGAVVYSSVVPGASSLSQYSSSVVHGAPFASVYSAPVYGPAVYSPAVYAHGALPYAAVAQAPHSPAVVLDAVRGVPLDTPEVVAARAAHYQAKALSGLHHLKKRSVGVAPVAYSSVVSPYAAYSSPVVSAYSTSVVSPYSAYSPVVSAYSAHSPIVSAYSTPYVSSPVAYHGLVPKALSVHPW